MFYTICIYSFTQTICIYSFTCWSSVTFPDPGPTEEDQLYEMYMAETNMVYRMQEDSLIPVEEYWGQCLKHELLKTDQVQSVHVHIVLIHRYCKPI